MNRREHAGSVVYQITKRAIAARDCTPAPPRH
jgi:hypothetical protein